MSESNHLVIDDVLPEEEFKKLTDYIVFNNQFPLTIDGGVALSPDKKDYDKDREEDYRNWYAAHVSYNNGVPLSNSYNQIASILTPVFSNLNVKALLKLKINFYPHTYEIFEHSQHIDYSFSCAAALLSLNTCDGFTRLNDGTKVESVANRMVIFHGNEYHNSSTTTNAKGRYNINFNYL